MKKRYYGIAALFVLCFSFLFFGESASAATDGTKVSYSAYVDTSGNIVLKYSGFCSTGYTYNVYKGTAQSHSGSLSGTAAAGSSVLTVPLKNNTYNLYQKNAKYQLVLTGKDKKKSLTVNYYTGTALTGYTVSQGSDNSLKASWASSDKTTYNGFIVGLYTGSTAAAAKVSVTAGAGDTSRSIASSSLTNASYFTCLTAYKTIGNIRYYGQGLTKTFDYVRKPSKVTGVKAVPKANSAKISWTAVKDASCYTVYKSTSRKKNYTAVKTNCTGTSLKVTGLKAKKTYYFKVVAVGRAGSKTAVGTASSVVSATIPKVAGKVKNAKLTLNSKKQLAVAWSRTKNATGYRVFYKKKTDLAWKKLGSTKKAIYALNSLDTDTKYNIKVVAYTKIGSKKYLSSKSSKILTVTPGVYMNKNYNKLLAAKVRTIGYSGNKCIYTKKKYTTEVKTAFVNYKGYSSKTKYLIWISHYTQQVSIFQGSKGKWKMIRTFICATGTAKNHSPIGVSKLSYKETGWYYTSTKELYVSHYWGRNSFHTRPLWNNGTVQNPTIGKPASHGCVRCYNQDAKYIYDKMPIGTTVVSY